MKKKVLLVLSLLMIVTGCEKKLENRGIVVNKKTIEEEKIEKTEELLNYDSILNDKKNKGFLLSTYSTISEVNFKNLFIEFPEEYSSLLNKESIEYNNLINLHPEFKDKDIYKLTSTSMKKYIKDKTGYGYEEFEKNGLSQLVYMEAYDAYYTFLNYSDELIDTYKYEINGNFHYIWYKYNENTYKVTLKEIDKKYYFNSNVIN